MKKLVAEETYPRNEIAKNMIYNKMKSHYRRLSSARAKVDTNLPKPPKNSLPLSREICEIVDRNYHCYKHSSKHRCLKELENSDFQFKPLILSTNTESKLKSLINVYHPPVRTPRRTKSRESNRVKLEEPNQSVNEGINLAEVDDTNETKEPEEQRTVIENIPIVSKKEMFVQTDHIPRHRMNQSSTYRPRDTRSLHFLRDITDEVLRKGAYTDDSLEAVFNYHVTLNIHNLDMETMENELDRLRDEVGMPRPGLRNSIHSDEEALDALESLDLDPSFKQEIINSLRLHNAENYHYAIIESQISNESLSSSKHSEVVEEPKSLEKPQGVSLKEQFLPGNLVIENKEEEEVEEDIGEMTSTTSEVSDIQEIEFEDIKKIIDDMEEENEENDDHSAAVKTITQSLSAVKSKTDSYKGNSEVNNSIHDTHSEISQSENNKNKEKSISVVKERDNKDDEESIMELKILKIEGISQEKEDDIKTITTNTDDHSSVKTDIKTELQSEITDEEVGIDDTAEEEEEEVVVDDDDDDDDVGNFETEEKSNRTIELAKSDSSSDMSSIKTEDSDN